MVYQYLAPLGQRALALGNSDIVRRGMDTADRIIRLNPQTIGRLLGGTGEQATQSFADDVKPPPAENRPQVPGYDATTGQKWDINNQRPAAEEEPRPLTIRPRQHPQSSVPAQMSPDAISAMYRRETGMEVPQFSPEEQYARETGRDITMQREAPPLPPPRPANLPGSGLAQRPASMPPMPPSRPVEEAKSILSSRDMYRGMDPNDERAGVTQFLQAAAREAQEMKAAREAEGKAYGGSAGYAQGGSTGSSGSGNHKDAALMKALEIIHHMLRGR